MTRPRTPAKARFASPTTGSVHATSLDAYHDIAAVFTSTVTVPPTSSPSPTPAVVIDLSTLVTITDYDRFYRHTPIASFHPVYYALDDGSLVAPPFVNDLRITNISLILIGVLLALFVRNILVSATYIRRGKFKKKGLLYTLLCSQLLALPCFIPIIVAQFVRDVDCGLVLRISSATTGLSLSLLITGILGVKAYRCLDNARLVLFALTALRTAATIVLIVDMIYLHGHRRLSGPCARDSVGLTPVFVILLFVESLFICCCFILAVWNSRGSPSVRGRISLQLSMEDVTEYIGNNNNKQTLESEPLSRRGWWDYVPTLESNGPSRLSHPPPPPTTSNEHGGHGGVVSDEWSVVSSRRHSLPLLYSARSRSRLESTEEGNGNASSNNHNNSTNLPPPVPKKHPFPPSDELPINRSRLPSTIRISETMERCSVPRREGGGGVTMMHRSESPALSVVSRFSRYVPRMALFREVMRDELCYTTFITATTVVSVVLDVVGVNSNDDNISSMSYIAFNWIIISFLVMHSFSRVIRRHELEAMIHDPRTYYPKLVTDRGTAEFLRPSREPLGLSRSSGGGGGGGHVMRARRTLTALAVYDEMGGVEGRESVQYLYPGVGVNGGRNRINSYTSNNSNSNLNGSGNGRGSGRGSGYWGEERPSSRGEGGGDTFSVTASTSGISNVHSPPMTVESFSRLPPPLPFPLPLPAPQQQQQLQPLSDTSPSSAIPSSSLLSSTSRAPSRNRSCSHSRASRQSASESDDRECSQLKNDFVPVHSVSPSSFNSNTKSNSNINTDWDSDSRIRDQRDCYDDSQTNVSALPEPPDRRGEEGHEHEYKL